MREREWLGGLRSDDLWDLYWDLGWGLPRIAQYLGVGPSTVRRLMLEAGIGTRHKLTRWYQPRPWYREMRAPQEEPDPADPAGFWGCTKSTRAGVGCLLCQEEMPKACGLDCHACPPDVLLGCPCFRHGDRELRRARLGKMALYTQPRDAAGEELGLDYAEATSPLPIGAKRGPAPPPLAP